MLWCADSRAYCPFRGRCCVVLVSIPALSQQLHESLWVCAAAGGGPGWMGGTMTASQVDAQVQHQSVIAKSTKGFSHAASNPNSHM